jgi:hypothetical protein
VGFIPVYLSRAQAAAREMRALRARLDKAVARAAKLQHAATTGEALVPTDLSVYAGAAADMTSALVGWAGATAAGVGSSVGSVAAAAAAAAAGAAAAAAGTSEAEPQAEEAPTMEAVDPSAM